MNAVEWKALSESERNIAIRNYQIFNPYSDEAYELVQNLGRELASEEQLDQNKVGVLNRFGELIIHLHFPESGTTCRVDKQDQSYYGFRVFYSGEDTWFDHLGDNGYVILKDLFEAKVPIRLVFHKESSIIFNRDKLEFRLTNESLSKKLSILIENGFVECFDKNTGLVTKTILTGDEDLFLGLTPFGGQTIEKKLRVDWSKYKNLEYEPLDKKNHCNWSVEANSIEEIHRVEACIHDKRDVQYTIRKIIPWHPVYWKTLDVGYKITITSPSTLYDECSSIYKWGVAGLPECI
ncbi:MAG: hypothetical protein V3W04_15460 [Gammaproteobacteria bacterium]